ncbi:MAG: tetratricopeptide repeat protein, partial [Syntrophales bacterium]|nr:tetratricopeptide repeat protein [Syntrophales bacterium]
SEMCIRDSKERAVYHLQESLRIRTDGGVHNDLGYVFVSLGRYHEAAAQFQAALALDPRNIKAMNNLGVVYAKERRYTEAASLFQRVLEIDPLYAAASYNLRKIREHGKGKQANLANGG